MSHPLSAGNCSTAANGLNVGTRLTKKSRVHPRAALGGNYRSRPAGGRLFPARILGLISILLAFLFTAPAWGACAVGAGVGTCTWNGGTSGSWSNPLNWTGGDVGDLPTNGDTLAFPHDAAGTLIMTNDIAGLSVVSLAFNAGGASTYSLAGGALTVTGGAITVGTNGSTVIFNNDGLALSATTIITVTGATSQVFFNKPVSIPAGGLTVSTIGTVWMDDVISGTGGITKAGAGGTLDLSQANTFSGQVNVNAGTLRIRNASALGTTSPASTANTVVSAGATLAIDGGIAAPIAEPLSLAGTLSATNSFTGGLYTWSGPITLTGNSAINVAHANKSLVISGAISGSFDLLHTGDTASQSRLHLTGNNTYTGTTTIGSGHLFAEHVNALGTSAGSTTVATGTNAALVIAVADGSTIAEPLTLNGGNGLGSAGLLQFTGTGSRTLSGAIALGGADSLIAPGSTTVTASGIISGGNGFVLMNGALILTGNNNYTGATTLFGGMLRVNGSQPDSTINFNGNATTLGGTGTVGHVNSTTVGFPKYLAPGSSPGRLMLGTGKILTMSISQTFAVELCGTTPGTGYDQISTDQPPVLDNATLSVSLCGGFTPTLGNTFTIIEDTGAGAAPATTFFGLPEGATFSIAGGTTLRINYGAGTGSNDVVLTVVSGGSGGSTYTLSVTQPTNGTISGLGITCGSGGSDCSEAYASGQSVTLTATANTGYIFTGWGGDCSGTSSCVLTMNANKSVSAGFVFAPSFNLSVDGAGTGNGTVTSSPSGISCTSTAGSETGTCTASFTSGTSVTLTAAAGTGSGFTGWSGGTCTGTSTCTVPISGNTFVTATFTAGVSYNLTLDGTGTGTGTVTSSPSGISCTSSAGTESGTCTASYSSGTSVVLTATPASGTSFVGWSGGGCSGTGTCTVPLTAATTVTANFTFGVVSYNLTVDGTGTGSGTVTSSPAGISCTSSAGSESGTCTASYISGTSVGLSATPVSGSSFTGWSGGGCSGTGTCTVTLAGATTVQAAFSTTGSLLPVPTSQNVYTCEAVPSSPVVSVTPASAKPMGVFNPTSTDVRVTLATAAFAGAVDVYVTARLPDGSTLIRSFSGAWLPYPANVVALTTFNTTAIDMTSATSNLYAGTLSSLAPGAYQGNVIVVPAGTPLAGSTAFYNWCYTKTFP